jgi:predicted peroxiredoxin
VRTLYFCTRGASDPTGASVPLHVAVNGSAEVGHDVAVVLAGDAAELVSQQTASSLQGIGVPSGAELFAKIIEREIPVYV